MKDISMLSEILLHVFHLLYKVGRLGSEENMYEIGYSS